MPLVVRDHVDVAGRTTDPALAAGRLWFRSDLRVLRFSPDGSTVVNIRGMEVGSVTTGSDGAATISFAARSSKPIVLLTPDADGVVAVIAGWITDAAGNYTGAIVRAYRLLPAVSKTAATVLADVTPSTDTFVKSIPSATGDAAGRYTVDANNVVHHDHPIPAPTTGSAVTGVAKSTTAVLADVSLSLQPADNISIFYMVV